MLASSRHDVRRQRGQAARQRLARSNSSFLGTLKTLVTTPFSWFSLNDSDAFEDEKDDTGKRRRNGAATVAQEDNREDGPTPAKRIRVASPDRHSQPAPGYLDPPTTAFGQQPNHSSHSFPNRSTLNSQPSNFDFPRNAVRHDSPQRSQLSRTMSIDPPRYLSRDVTMGPAPSFVGQDVSMEPLSNSSLVQRSFSASRDHSMPPLSARPSFRLRTSLTPQPHHIHRDISEPPPITSLAANPVFVRPPPADSSPVPTRKLSATPSTTLGSLTESQRQHRSTHSLLYGQSGRSEPAVQKFTSIAEKTLHDLDVYKTPLIPTRMRARHGSQPMASDSNVTDLFRRKVPLVLMEQSPDGKRSSKDKKDKEVNESKPYAGEGGMKKLLARRRQEAEELLQKEKHERDTLKVDRGSQASEEDVLPPPLPKKDWFSLASDSTPQTGQSSSLRVGRTLTHRSHGAAVRTKNKFSAAFEEEEEQDATEESRRERQLLEDAAKKAPTFDVSGFSFAKNPQTKPIDLAVQNAKEPPVSSLPFSLKPTTAIPTTVAGAFNVQASPVVPPQPAAVSEQAAVSTPAVPNFFGSSSFLAQAATVPPTTTPQDPPTWTFGKPIAEAPATFAPAVPSSAPSTPSVVLPLNSGSSPESNSSLFGMSKPKDTAVSKFGIFTPPVEKGKENISTTSETPIFSSLPVSPPSTTSLFGAKKDETDKPGFSFNAVSPSNTDTPSSSFSFMKPDNASSSISKAFEPNSPLFAAPISTTAPSQPSMLFGGSSGALPSVFGSSKASEASSSVEPSISGGTDSKPIEAPRPLFGGTSFSFGAAKPDATSEPVKAISPFSFGAPPSTPPVPDTSKSMLFGGSTNGFSSEEPKKPAFTFGGPPSTSSIEEPKKAPFTFGAPASSAVPVPEEPKQSGFTFGGASSSAPEPEKAPFTFGGSTLTTPTATLATSGFSFGGDSGNKSFGGFGVISAPNSRPVTPPRQESQDQEFRMDESPTRDIVVRDQPTEPRPGLGGFAFSSGGSSNIFAQPSKEAVPQSTGFSFGGAPSGGSLFASTPSKPADPQPFASGFGQQLTPTTTNGFSFDRPATAEAEPPRPSTGGSFGFSSPPAPTPQSFAFGAPTPTNSFGQIQSGSAPNSPSTFRTGSFAFGQPAASSTFGFGSQPSSPAAAPQTSLPVFSSTASFGNSQPSSPFGAPPPNPFGETAAPAPPSGGGMFTIGAAPAPPSGTRLLKKLPTRRAVKR